MLTSTPNVESFLKRNSAVHEIAIRYSWTEMFWLWPLFWPSSGCRVWSFRYTQAREEAARVNEWWAWSSFAALVEPCCPVCIEDAVQVRVYHTSEPGFHSTGQSENEKAEGNGKGQKHHSEFQDINWQPKILFLTSSWSQGFIPLV